MRFVLDASVAVNWAMRDESNPVADLAFSAIRSGTAVVPGIWWYEIRSILVVNERRQRITPADSNRFLIELLRLEIAVDNDPDSSAVLDLSRRLGRSVYDAAYLALAMREHIPLATLDKNLEAAAVAEGIALLR
ncbi:MAG: type II toxin-antitoxin system VapC family toxin [Terracidiphilus sp.]|jgi:predicted nucleic acid-binding protein